MSLKTNLRMNHRISLLFSALFSLAISLVLVYVFRSEGLLEPYELKLLDSFWLERQESTVSKEITLVTISEEDINKLEQYPLSDVKLIQLLESIIAAQPRVIGLDLIRNLAVTDKNLTPAENELAYLQLQNLLRQTDNLYGIGKITETSDFPSIPGLSALSPSGRLAAADLVLDKDGVARRGNLYPDYEQNLPGLGLATALSYLEPEGIYPQAASQQESQVCPLPKDYPQSGWLQFGSQVLCPLTPRFGGYVTHSDSGYQVLLNWPSCQNRFPTISLSEIFQGSFEPELLKNRLVLIGNTSLSGKDLFLTPCSHNTGNTPRQMPGVEIQANLAQQIIGIANGTTKPISSWSEMGEIGWIVVWAIGWQAILSGFFRDKSLYFGLLTLISLPIFAFLSYQFSLSLFLAQNLWLPLVPVWLCLIWQAFFTLILFAQYRANQINASLELQVKERTLSLQQALDNLRKIQQQMIAQGKLNFLGKNTVYISHEIRNPLGAIELANLISKELIKNLAQLESLSHEQSTFDTLLDNSHKIEQSIERINHIIVLLNEQVKSDERPALDCELNELIDEALEITIYSFGIRHNWTKAIEIETDYDPNLPPVRLYRSDFERAICNLIDNSLYSLKQKQASNPDFVPQLWLSTKKLDDEQVQIILEDNGEGIAPEDEKQIFEEFYSTKGEEGTGLGLFIVKQIIEGKHDGQLALETKWSEFTRMIIKISLTEIN